jgi:Zn finger protein HypA/HybF involved in hydrogenase expression
MVQQDPHETDEPPHRYECVDCGERVEAESHPVECPECGGEMQNISKAQE